MSPPPRPHAAPSQTVGRALLALHATLALATAALLFGVRYVPMVDLPQHAAQLYLLEHFTDPALHVRDHYRLHLATPYLLANALAFLVGKLVSARVALKVVTLGALLATVLATDRLVRRVGGERVAVLLVYPALFGFSFAWGFVSFLVAVPLAILLVERTHHLMEVRSRATRGGSAVAVLAMLLFAAHALAFVFGVAASSLVVLGRSRDARAAARGLLPLLLPLPIALAWLHLGRLDAHGAEPVKWAIAPIARLRFLLVGLLGPEDDEAALVPSLLLVVLALASGRLSPRPARLGPLVLAVAGVLLLPMRALGTHFVSARFVTFVAPTLAAAIDPVGHIDPVAPVARVARVARFALPAAALVWLAVLGTRFRAFDEDARDLDRVAAAVRSSPPPRVLSLCFQPESEATPGVPFLHAAAWIAAERGGLLGFSFAENGPAIVRFRAGAEPRMTRGLEQHPERFDPATDADYDYLLARAPAPLDERALHLAPGSLALAARAGRFFLYELRR